MKQLFLLIVFTMFGALLLAQSPYAPSFTPNFNLNGIFNPEKINMQQSMSFSSGMSSNGQGFYQSAYNNKLQFDLKPNLKFNVDVSLINAGTMTHQNDLNFKSNKDNNNFIVPGFSLEYRPTENSVFHIEYKQVRGFQNITDDRNSPWWR